MEMNVNKITTKLTKSLGSIAVIKPILDKLEIAEVIDKYSSMNRATGLTNGMAIEIAIINRLMAPKPLYKMESWAKDVAIEEVYDIPSEKINDDRLGRALEAIHPYIEEIESELATRAITTFNISSDLIHYDITSIYFEGDHGNSERIDYGYSRDQKPDKKQINLGLNVDREGIPLSHNIYDGNTSDQKTVIQNMQNLRKRLKTDEFVIVGDRGMISSENIVAYEENALRYIGTLKLGKEHKELIKSIDDSEFEKLDYTRGNGAYYGVNRELTFKYREKEVNAKGLIVKSEKKEEKDRKNREKGIKKITDKLEHIFSNINKRKYKKREYTEEQTKKALTGKYKKYIEYYLEENDEELSFDFWVIDDLVKEDSKMDGKYIIVTNVHEYTKSQLLNAYKSRFIVESRIRNMKSDIKVRPLFLQNDERIESLVFVTILALMVYSILETLCRRENINITSRTLLEIFGKLSLIKLVDNDGEILILEDLSYYQSEVLKRLRFPMPEVYIENCC
jgi:transposase